MTRSGRRTLYLVGAALLVIALVGGRWLAVETVERAWDRTFRGGETLIHARTVGLTLQLVLILFAAAWATGNLLIVYRSIGSVQMPRRLGDLEIVEAVSQRVLLAITIGAGVLLGILLSLGTSEWWRYALLAASPPHLGIPDQTLGHDAGYYLAVLPWQAALQNRALILAIGALAAVALLYALIGSLRVRRGRLRAADHARLHLGFLLASLALVIFWGAILDPAEVVAGLHGTADQAALSVRIPGAAFVAAVSIVTAVISLIWGWRDRPNLILAGWAALLLSVTAGYGVIPGVVRASGSDDGTTLARRRAMLERAAFGLDSIESRALPAFSSGEAAIAAIPVWDPARIAAATDAGLSGVSLRPVANAPTWLIAPTASSSALRVAVETDSGLTVRELARTEPAPLFAPGTHGNVLIAVDSAPGALRAAGIPITGSWRRFALAWTIQMWELLRAESADHLFLYRRDAGERLERIAPFAHFDAPMPALMDGSLWWISWGYVGGQSFPLVRPLAWQGGDARFLRAGVIGAVRATTGESRVWLAPRHDSLTAAWARHFEPLVEPASAIPEALRAQLAYPREVLETALAQLIRQNTDTDGVAWSARPRRPSQLVAPDGELWSGVALESGGLAPKVFEGLLAGTVTAAGPRLYFWRGSEAADRPARLPGPLVGSIFVRPGEPRIWPVDGSLITVQAQFAEPAGVTPAPAPRIALVYVSLNGRNGRGPTARAALHGGESAVTDTTLGARWMRARRLATQADSALGAGDLELFGRLWRSLLRELAPAPRPR